MVLIRTAGLFLFATFYCRSKMNYKCATTPISSLFRFILGRGFQVFDDLCGVSSNYDVRRYVFSDNSSGRNNTSKYLASN